MAKPAASTENTAAPRQRIDKWLFFARIVKSRSLAAKLVEAGKVRINREKTVSPSHAVRPGDVLTVTLDRDVRICRVLSPGERRGPAPEARLLYEDLTPPAPAKDGSPEELPQAVRPEGAGRPEKRDRRTIDQLKRRMIFGD